PLVLHCRDAIGHGRDGDVGPGIRGRCADRRLAVEEQHLSRARCDQAEEQHNGDQPGSSHRPSLRACLPALAFRRKEVAGRRYPVASCFLPYTRSIMAVSPCASTRTVLPSRRTNTSASSPLSPPAVTSVRAMTVSPSATSRFSFTVRLFSANRPRCSITSALPWKVPLTELSPGWTHSMSSSNRFITVSMSPAAKASRPS